MATQRLWVLVLICLVASRAEGGAAPQGDPIDGDVNLVEFNIRGVTYGKCSFTNRGQEVILQYEERGLGNIVAKSLTPTDLDPIAKVLECRREAVKVPRKQTNSRSSSVALGSGDTDQELIQRLARLQTNLAANQEYISYLQPRFFKDMFQNIGLVIGGSSDGNSGSGFGLHLDEGSSSNNEDEHNPFAIGFSPFKKFGR